LFGFHPPVFTRGLLAEEVKKIFKNLREKEGEKPPNILVLRKG